MAERCSPRRGRLILRERLCPRTAGVGGLSGALVVDEKSGVPCRIRTYDPLIKSQLLYQLS